MGKEIKGTASIARMGFLLAVLLLVGAAWQPARGQEWVQDITVSEAGGTSRTLQFGVHPNGTDGIDNGVDGTTDLGEVEYPPKPISGAFDTRFVDLVGENDIGEGLTVDRRTGTAEHRLTIYFQRGAPNEDRNGDIIISWDASQLAAVTTSARLQDPFTSGDLLNIDLRTTSQAVIDVATKLAWDKVDIVFTSASSLTGDFDGSGGVDFGDFFLFADAFGT